MRKNLVILLGLTALPLCLFAAERVVTLEIFTSTGCGYCPGAAMGAEDMAEAYPGKVLIIEYHALFGGDPFDHTDATAREDFYSGVVRGYPTSIFDGVDTLIGGFQDQSLFDPWYKNSYTYRHIKSSPLSITLSNSAAAYSSTSGTLQAHITNESDNPLTGTVHFVITESKIPHSWMNQTELNFVERDMLPDANGAPITLAPGEDTTITREYTIDTEWLEFTEDENIEFGCFVQSTQGSGSLREIYQAAVRKFGDTTTIYVEEPYLEPDFSVTVSGVVKDAGYATLSLNASSDVEVALYDAAGREVSNVYRGTLSSGEHSIPMDTRSLPEGAYFVKVTAGTQTQVRKLLVVR